jgi:hypothetical protein
MITLQEYKQSKGIQGLVQKMFEARQVAHNCHLSSKSFSEHEALGSFYDGLLGLVDEFVETYQGQYGLLEHCECKIEPVADAIGYLEDCAKLFAVGRESLKEKDTHLKNIMDEVIALAYRTIYKLKNLK